MKKVLAFDLGASNGRAILGTSNNNGITDLTEIHRFANTPVAINGRLYWDVLGLFSEIMTALSKCAAMGHSDIASIGIDTWGVDYGLLDKNGHLIANPRHYRDPRTIGIVGRLADRLLPQYLWSQTGNRPAEINTAYQLASEPLPKDAGKLLFMPDLLAYFLTGEMCCEKTILSTSQLYDFSRNEFCQSILDGIGVTEDLFPPVTEPGTVIGTLTRDIAAKTGLPQIPVIAVAGHDTASAFAAVRLPKNSAFISCGTWSIVGILLDERLTSTEAFAGGFTNEIAYGGKTRFIKNITGLWIEQQCIESWRKQGQDVSYDILDAETAASDTDIIIDPTDPLFTAPPDMPAAIAEYCRNTGQPIPASRGEYLSCIIRSLAAEYNRTVTAIESLTGQNIDTIYIAGGGVKNKLLCKYTEQSTGRRVVIGPAEATAMGNVTIQLTVDN